jgi:hypothetical protein
MIPADYQPVVGFPREFAASLPTDADSLPAGMMPVTTGGYDFRPNAQAVADERAEMERLEAEWAEREAWQQQRSLLGVAGGQRLVLGNPRRARSRGGGGSAGAGGGGSVRPPSRSLMLASLGEVPGAGGDWRPSSRAGSEGGGGGGWGGDLSEASASSLAVVARPSTRGYHVAHAPRLGEVRAHLACT